MTGATIDITRRLENNRLWKENSCEEIRYIGHLQDVAKGHTNTKCEQDSPCFLGLFNAHIRRCRLVCSAATRSFLLKGTGQSRT